MRGVGCGLPLARDLMAGGRRGARDRREPRRRGGRHASAAPPGAGRGPAPSRRCSEAAREILALLLEVGAATPETLARELGRPRTECGRELALLSTAPWWSASPAGPGASRTPGAALVATLF